MKRPLARLVSFFVLASVTLVCLLLTHHPAQAFSSSTAGDGFIPIVYKSKVYNIFHHQTPSNDPANPNYDINCVDPVTEQTCATYPRFFSSTNGSTGSLSTGTAGTQDIITSTLPQGVIIGSKLFYAANRASDNGIGCYDLDVAQNCGYTQLGTLAKFSSGFGFAGQTDGIEQVGNKLYTIGINMNMYCLDVTDPNSPVACSSQPYAVNTGITGQLPTMTDNIGTPRLISGTKIFFVANYKFASSPADARLTCFDTTSPGRCSGWSSVDITASSGQSLSETVFEFPDTSGTVSSVCAAQTITESVQCVDTTSSNAVSAPPNMLSGITKQTTDNLWQPLRIGQKTFFAAHVLSPASGGMAICYDFTAQARCSGFGMSGVKVWDGSDGGMSVNGGDTRDYGYAVYANNCMLGLGDAGVMWSFDAASGFTTGSVSSCSPIIPKLPNTGLSPLSGSTVPMWLFPAGVTSLIGGAIVVRRARK